MLQYGPFKGYENGLIISSKKTEKPEVQELGFRAQKKARGLKPGPDRGNHSDDELVSSSVALGALFSCDPESEEASWGARARWAFERGLKLVVWSSVDIFIRYTGLVEKAGHKLRDPAS